MTAPKRRTGGGRTTPRGTKPPKPARRSGTAKSGPQAHDERPERDTGPRSLPVPPPVNLRSGRRGNR
jgi:hypothetical protein